MQFVERRRLEFSSSLVRLHANHSKNHIENTSNDLISTQESTEFSFSSAIVPVNRSPILFNHLTSLVGITLLTTLSQ